MLHTSSSLLFKRLGSGTLLVTIMMVYMLSCQQKRTNKLIIATAANMQFAMIELVEIFSKKTGIECETILGSSGKLTAQVVAGAPYHIFVAADMKYPQQLYEQGLTEAEPRAFASGRLVLWTMDDTPPSLPATLRNNEFSHIAIANPQTAPYGRAARETLEKLGLYEQLKSKLVYGESIAQTNQFITSEAAQIGFTAKSVVLAPELRDRGTWMDIPPGYHSPLDQGVVILKKDGQLSTEASAFYEFLFSAEAKEILNKFGYTSLP